MRDDDFPTTPDTPTAPPVLEPADNAFSRLFLDLFQACEETHAAREDHPDGGGESLFGPFALYAGPWEVRPVPTAGWGCFARGEREPELTFDERAFALLAAAVLPALPRLGRFRHGVALGREGGSEPVLLEGRERLGVARHHHDHLPEALGLMVHLVSDPASLAHLLEAAGSTSLERTGAVLADQLDGEPN